MQNSKMMKENKLTNNSCIYNKIFLITFIWIICSSIHTAHGLYEDQIGKFDWKQSFIGKISAAHFYGQLSDRIIVATEENVLAALNVKTGEIVWRKTFEKNERGHIKLLHVETDPSKIVGLNADENVITVSGASPALIRGWNGQTGNIEWEWSLTPTTPSHAESTQWFYDNLYIYHVVPVFKSHIEVTTYFASTGQQIKQTTTKIPAAWISEEACVLAVPYYVCTNKNQIIGIDLTSESNELLRKVLSRDVDGEKPRLLPGAAATIVIGNDIYCLTSDQLLAKSRASEIMFNEKYAIPNKNILLKASIEDQSVKITSQDLETGEALNEIYIVAHYPELASSEIVDVRCKLKGDGQAAACRIIFSAEDGTIVLMQQGKIKWTRQEALSKIVAIEMIDLPLSDAEGSIENELKNKDGDLFGAFIRRLSTQVIQFRNLILTVMGLGAPPSASQKAGLIRDAFGLHKMMVVVTAFGKIFGIDNVSGKHHWVKYLPHFIGFNSGQNMQILIQRSSGHFPYQAQCVIVARNKINGNGILYQFNPISGNPVNDGVVELNYEIRQFSLLHETKQDFFKSILILDKSHMVHVYPESGASFADSMYLYTADKDTGTMIGYFIQYKEDKLISQAIWKINLSGSDQTQKITNIGIKNPNEHVHSQGRVFNDRSVLYKYINPNLVAVATQGPDPMHKYILNVHLIDVVSGGIVYSMTHRRVKGPMHMIHSENWLIYSYYNDKVRRTEVTTVELYEGKTQANSTVWSSLDAPQLPMVERQSYIIPANVAALKETITEKGIANKHVLIGLSSGSIIEMPWALLDPRRPILVPNQVREEGIIPYIPELQLPSENVINYNQSVTNIQGIYTAPSGLESTCLVVAYGLDLFVTRVAPSKTFDLLKEDFDYILISIVLSALTIASVVVKNLSTRKALKQAWK